MLATERTAQIAKDWIDSWNRHDLDSILTHYSEDIELTSPIVIKLLGDESGTIRGKDALRGYFEKGLAAYPDLRFEMLEVFTGVNSIVLYYGRHKGPLGAELMVLNREDKIERVIAHYVYAK
ncbi:MAG: nuclear transport factor 2 family protein [Candidatus Dadabacteria bacterium]|nr:nuclear transport factor 2 family protein [Candidatus Dadabacteria bacterium]